MRVMVMIKGDPEPGAAPGEDLLAAMGRYNDELKQAGVLLDLAGLLPSVQGRRVRFSGGTARFPFEAWSRIYPGEYGAEVEIEIRQVLEPGSL